MLQFLRRNTKILAWVFVVLFGILFGVSSISLRKEDQYAGEAFGKKVTFQEYRIFETITRLMPQSRQLLEDPAVARQYIWQQIALSREAKQKGIEVSNDEVKMHVDRLVNGESASRLSPGEYRHLLRGWRTTPNEFEKGIREVIRIQKLVTPYFEGMTNPAEVLGDDAVQKAASAKAAAENQAKKDEYARWLTDLNQRAQVQDYSASKTLPH